jgi:hypothetical protein
MGPFPFVDRAGRGSGQAEVAASEPVGSLAPVPLEIPDFQAYCGSDPPQFQNEAELECAKILDYYGIPWEYEPRTFVLERRNGRVVEACTPDFYLPHLDVYLECTVQQQKNVRRKNRKLRKLRQRFGVTVGVLYRRDILRLARTYGLEELEAAVDA